ncbi:MAG: hypothetical protein GY786_06605 [Proteobacteria bacterium]|nr:hypothetical protein [Pseudomonadota bacterium]
MKKDISIITLAVILLCLGSISPIQAQVVTPSLDPTEPGVFPAVAGWRPVTTVGISTYERTGSRADLSIGENYYEFLGTGSTVFFNFKMGDSLAAEGFSGSETITIGKDTYKNGSVTTGLAESRFAITLSHEDFAVFGLALQTDQVDEHLTDVSADSDVSTTETKTIPSLSIKFWDYYYLGGGLERVKQSSRHMVDNHWSNSVIGLSFMAGSPDMTMFRLEYSSSNSPKAVSAPKGSKDESYHPETTITRINAELKIQGLVLIAATKSIVKNYGSDYIGQTEKEDLKVTTKMGVLLSPVEGPVLGFIFHNESEEYYFEDEFETFEIKVAYAF